MSAKPDPRRIARLHVPLHLGAAEIAHHRVQVLNLSPLGVCLAHDELLRDGVVCYVDLLPPLGPVRLTGRVVWTRLRTTEQTVAGEQRTHYESGVEFVGSIHERQAGLAAVVATLRAVQHAGEQAASR